LNLLTQIIRLLLAMIQQQRGRTLHEQRVSYQTVQDKPEPTVNREVLDTLLQNVPFP
jgi:hypothetical protein